MPAISNAWLKIDLMGELLSKILISEKRKYKVLNTQQAKDIVDDHLRSIAFEAAEISYGLPEIDDRYHVWRVPILKNKGRIGEVVIDAISGNVNLEKSTDQDVLKLAKPTSARKTIEKKEITISNLNNMVIEGNSIEILKKISAESVNLVFTSPPYYNARPEYSEYSTYEEYLELMRKVIRESHRVLSEGRFFVLNISAVLIRRASRSEASKRIAVPFDFHRIFIEEGFDFIDDIHWVKPEGAGWSLGRGRRFAADRNPLQYKAVPITEYILVYRKKTDRLIDWNIRNHPDQKAVAESKIDDSYEKTNLWRINPSRSKDHPATFPVELAEKVIRYYSFKNDVVLDPFGGSGTTGIAALNLNRRFVMCELENKYVQTMKKRFSSFDLFVPISFMKDS
jgi:DNA modification methylase